MSKIRISETKNSESDLMLMFATSLQNSCTGFYLDSKNKTLINTWNARKES